MSFACVVCSHRLDMTEEIFENLKKIDRNKVQKIENLTFFEKIYFSGF